MIDEGIYWIDLFRVDRRQRGRRRSRPRSRTWCTRTSRSKTGAWRRSRSRTAIVATLEASWTINAPRKTGPSPKQNSVIRLELVGTRGEIIDQWFRAPGRAVLAAGAADWVFERQSEQPVRAGRTVSAEPPDRLPRERSPARRDDRGCPPVLHRRDGGLRLCTGKTSRGIDLVGTRRSRAAAAAPVSSWSDHRRRRRQCGEHFLVEVLRALDAVQRAVLVLERERALEPGRPA